MGGTKIFLALIAMAVLYSSKASHFRGGTVSWKHIQSNGNVHELEIYFRLGWRRDSASDICDASTLNGPSTTYNQGSWALDSRATSPDFPYSTALICTSYDTSANWAYGFNNFRASITASGPFNIIFSGNAWIGGMAFGGGSWSVAAVDIDLGVRSDTGIVNRSPKALSQPLVKLILGCSESIKIVVDDDDRDPITCRYAVGSTECNGICGQYRYFTLDKATCTLYYDGAGTTGLVPVALMIEDHPNQTITVGSTSHSTSDVLSSIPLQILFEITTASTCNDKPTIPTNLGPQESQTFAIPRNGGFNSTLYAYPSSGSTSIAQFIILGPVGVQLSAIFSLGNSLFASSITWQPSPTQAGNHRICFYAVDTLGINGQRVCFYVDVAAITSPCDVNNGGCSDVCNPQGAFHTCSCSMPCWRLEKDQRTCAPEMTVTCDGENMDIFVEKCASNRTVVAGSKFDYFTQTTCQSIDTNSTHHLNFSPLDCGLLIQANPVVVEYDVHIWLWKAKETGSAVITRGIWQGVPVTCTMGSSFNLTGSFVPEPPLNDEFFPKGTTIEGVGTVTLYFEYYRTGLFSATFSPPEYPIQVSVADRIYFSLGAIARTGLTFFTERCVAMPNRTLAASASTYSFIDDGCLIDPSLIYHNTSSAMEHRFSMEAFEFEDRLLETRENSEIFVQCQVRLCNASRNDTRCAQGCLPSSSRRKRSLESDIMLNLVAKSRETRNVDEDEDENQVPGVTLSESDLEDLASRFILIVDPERPKGEEESGGTNLTNYILIGLAVLLLATLIFVAYRVVQNKRTKMIPNPKA